MEEEEKPQAVLGRFRLDIGNIPHGKAYPFREPQFRGRLNIHVDVPLGNASPGPRALTAAETQRESEGKTRMRLEFPWDSSVSLGWMEPGQGSFLLPHCLRCKWAGIGREAEKESQLMDLRDH